MKEKVTAVLIEKGPIYPQIVLERLDLPDTFDEIIVVVDCPSIYHRYLAAQKAKNSTIYFQDSDCLINFQILFEKYNGQITNAMTPAFQKQYEPLGCTLVGWGCYINKAMLSVFDRYITKYGENDAHLLREADRIFTAMNRPFNSIFLPHENLAQATDKDRMCYEERHYQSMEEALEKVKSIL